MTKSSWQTLGLAEEFILNHLSQSTSQLDGIDLLSVC